MNWKRFYRRDCPICNGLRKDCRQNLQTTLIHCRQVDADPPNYIFRGYDKIGFGLWADRLEAETWNQEKHREWIERRQREQERQQKRRNNLLCDQERDVIIRTILSQLELSPEHRLHLQQRGMNDEQISAGMYRTVKPWQKLNIKVDTRLAGIQETGRRLYIPASGILCPISNAQGELVGWQIRLDEATRENLPKYLWASSKSEPQKNTPSVHLKCGELPLAFLSPSVAKAHLVVSKWFRGQSSILPVALTEGVAFKPAITAQRLGIYTIGASGGNIASSPTTLKAYLEHIKKTHQGCQIVPILFPDAGCLSNTSILRVYENTIRELQQLGFEPKIAWWEQSDKVVGDIDEIDDDTVSSIRLLSHKDFLHLVKKNQYIQDVQGLQHQLQTLTYESNLCFQSRYLPDLSELLPRNGLVALKSPKGTGKSVQIQKIIQWVRGLRMNVISLTPRRALGREQSLKWGINWIGDSEVPGVNLITVLENMETIGLCWDSLWKLKERDWSNTLVIIDEAELALVHLLLSSTCKEKRPLILRVLENKLKECLANKGMLLVADADLSNLSIDYFKALVPEVPVFIVTNDYQGPETHWQIDFHTGKKDQVIAQLIADLAVPVVANNSEEESIERQRRIAIPTDSQEQAEALGRYIQECYPHLIITRIDSTTTETDEGRNFVERPNEMISKLKPDILIYTSSMGAGVSIDLAWFDQIYAFFVGVLEPSQCRQMLSRVRDPIPRSIWCCTQGHLESFSSFFPDEIKSRLYSLNRETSILIDVVSAITPDNASDSQIRQAYEAIWNREEQTWNNPHLDLYCNLAARKNFGLYHFYTELRRQLVMEGHTLRNYHSTKNTVEGTRVKTIKKSLSLEEAQTIAKAKDIPLETALLLKQKASPTEEQRHQITKALLHAELPGIELTAEFIYKAITKDRRRWLNAQKLFWYSQHPEITKVIDRKEWLHHLQQFTDGVIYLPDIKTYSLQVKLLKDLRLFKVIDLNNPEKEYSSEDMEIKRLLYRARKQAKLLRLTFNLHVSVKTKAIQFINHLLKRLGLYLKFHHQSSKGIRFYRLDMSKLDEPERLAVLESLTAKWSHLETKFSQSQQANSHDIYNSELYCDPQINVHPVEEVYLGSSDVSQTHNKSPG